MGLNKNMSDKKQKSSIAFFGTPPEIVDIMIEQSNLKYPILETGFGECSFLEGLKKMNMNEVFGIEYSEEFFNIAKNKYPEFNLINEDYLKYNKEVNTIIGNPPYISIRHLDEEMKNITRSIIGKGDINLYYAFIVHSISLLNEGGEISYILPYDFFFNTYACGLRNRMVESGYFEYIIDLKELKVFNGASPDCIIFKWIKSNNKENKIKVFSLEQKISYKNAINYLKEVLSTNISNQVFSFKEINQFKQNENFVLTDNFEGEFIKIKDICNVSVGIVSGADSIFKYNIEVSKEEQKYIKKIIKNKDFINNKIQNPDSYIFFSDNEFKNEEEIKLKIPNIYKHLKENENDLKNRYISSGKKWFNYLAIRNLKENITNENKYRIMFPAITRKENNWFSLIKEPGLCGGDSLMITGEEKVILYLYEYLNSDFFIELYKKHGNKKGNRIFFSQSSFSNFKIPINEELSSFLIKY